MGDEHGMKVLMPRYQCEEPSAPAGFFFSRPAGACLRRETTTASGRPFGTLQNCHSAAGVARVLRKARRAAVAARERAAPARKATFGPKSFHQRPNRMEAGRAARPTTP